MIDINKNNLRILPVEHIILKDISKVENIQQENKTLKTILIVGGGAITAYILYSIFKKDEKRK